MPTKNYQDDPVVTIKKRENYHRAKVMGQTLKEISEETGQSVRQISYDIADIVYYIQASPEFQAAGDAIVSMIPKSMATYHKHLDDYDLLAARDVMKWIGIHVERTKLSGNVNLSSMSNDELTAFVVGAITQGKSHDKLLKDKEIHESVKAEHGISEEAG